MNKLTGLQTYIFWLQQLENTQSNIYALSEEEIIYLMHFVETHIGCGVVFANNILCELYGICIEDAVRGTRYEVRGNDEMIDLPRTSNLAPLTSNSITVVPNPTTGELRVSSVEVFDVYGRKTISDIRHPISEIGKSEIVINISYLTSGIYFVKVFTETGIVVKKVLKL